MIEADAEPAVYVTEHWREEGLPVPDRLQVVAVKEPPAPPSSKDTVPWGADRVPPVWVSVTVAVQLEVVPLVSVAGEQTTAVVVARVNTREPLAVLAPPVSVPPALTVNEYVPGATVVVDESFRLEGRGVEPLKVDGENVAVTPVGSELVTL